MKKLKEWEMRILEYNFDSMEGFHYLINLPRPSFIIDIFRKACDFNP